ncbi:dTMP kinase [Ideonella livida]|uniref:Thymidylate kinase n=1 Tax=Ideonella livida TaxID=2707176 RepID=A0A7C9TJX1_9BURK|nr:dTMP kinase [Ideonella livida]NDY90527.1 dTMP kinase [Ideonella livida]
MDPIPNIRRPRPLFITVEGIDGAGKSSQLAALRQALEAAGHTVVATREPGGTPLAESLRALFLHQPMDALTEALLVFAARRDHLATVIEPALAQGHTVLCDRFTDATFAYQGGGRRFDLAVLQTLEAWVQNGRQPDLTLWFDLDPALAARRRQAAREADRLEQETLDFFDRVRAGYLARAQAAPGRIVRVEAGQALADVQRDALAALQHYLQARGALA